MSPKHKGIHYMNYDWQDSLFGKWKDAGFVGLLKAVPGAGKTRAGITLIESLNEEGHLSDDNKCMIIAPTKAICSQWSTACEESNLGEVVEVYTMDKIVNMTKAEIVCCDTIIIDEAHKMTTDRRIEALDRIDSSKIFACTATPDDYCLMNLGPILDDIDFERANIAPFEIVFHEFMLDEDEQEEFGRIQGIIYALGGWKTEAGKIQTFKRRALVYGAKGRFQVLENEILPIYPKSEKMLVVTQKIDHAEKVYSHAKKCGYAVGITHSKKSGKDIDRFKNGEIQKLVAVKQLNTGFNVPDLSVVVVFASTTSLTEHVQTIGRAIRFQEGKFARIHIIIAKNTSDERIYNHKHMYQYRWFTPESTEDPELYHDLGEDCRIDRKGFVVVGDKTVGRTTIFDPEEISEPRYFRGVMTGMIDGRLEVIWPR